MHSRTVLHSWFGLWEISEADMIICYVLVGFCKKEDPDNNGRWLSPVGHGEPETQLNGPHSAGQDKKRGQTA